MLTLRGLPKSEKERELAGLGPGGRRATWPLLAALCQSSLAHGLGLGDCEEDLHLGLV